MFRKLFLFSVLLLICSLFIACFESSDDPENAGDVEEPSVITDTISEVADLTGRGPAVRLIDEGMEGTVRR